MLDTKVCRKCKVEYTLDNYYLSHGYRLNTCKLCEKERSRIYHAGASKELKQYWNRGTIKSRYGITREDYDGMLSSQNYVCAICSKPDNIGWCLSVDHDHKTGKVRGLLCNSCNHGLGHFRDSPEILIKAANYLGKV